jgi:hypothetical protein
MIETISLPAFSGRLANAGDRAAGADFLQAFDCRYTDKKTTSISPGGHHS